nr:MAG TPA: hypothetical protein [Caudoviricetes sp.]
MTRPASGNRVTPQATSVRAVATAMKTDRLVWAVQCVRVIMAVRKGVIVPMRADVVRVVIRNFRC